MKEKNRKIFKILVIIALAAIIFTALAPALSSFSGY
jgi:hypothetical protein